MVSKSRGKLWRGTTAAGQIQSYNKARKGETSSLNSGPRNLYHKLSSLPSR